MRMSLGTVFKKSNSCFWQHLKQSRGRFSTHVHRQKNVSVSVEGNIGSGKTTFIQHFRSLDQPVEVVEEPLSLWRDLAGHKPLETLYSDPQRWAFTFQTLVIVTMLQQHESLQKQPLRVMERSLFSARYCFIENQYRRGNLSHFEYSILDMWFQQCLNLHKVKVDLIVYLKTRPEVCYARIKERQRQEEQNISLNYLMDLHQLHEAWLVKGDHTTYRRPHVLVVDANTDLEKMEGIFHKVCSHLRHYQHSPDNHTVDPGVILIHN